MLWQAPAAVEEGSIEPVAGDAPARSVTPSDFGELGNLNLTAYVVDFSRGELPKKKSVPDNDLNKVFGSVMKSFKK